MCLLAVGVCDSLVARRVCGGAAAGGGWWWGGVGWRGAAILEPAFKDADLAAGANGDVLLGSFTKMVPSFEEAKPELEALPLHTLVLQVVNHLHSGAGPKPPPQWVRDALQRPFMGGLLAAHSEVRGAFLAHFTAGVPRKRSGPSGGRVAGGRWE